MNEVAKTEQSDSAPMRLAQHLAADAINGRCELTTDNGSERCEGKSVAVRWEDGFADAICEHHAETAAGRGVIVVYARRHDGTRS